MCLSLSSSLNQIALCQDLKLVGGRDLKFTSKNQDVQKSHLLFQPHALKEIIICEDYLNIIQVVK